MRFINRLCVISLLLIFVVGCNFVSSEENSVFQSLISNPAEFKWYNAIKNGFFGFSNPVIEKGNEIFYVSDEGLNVYKKTSGVNTLLHKNPDISTIFLTDDGIFCCENKKEIYSLDYNGQNRKFVWNQYKLPNDFIFDYIYDFQIHKGILYLMNSIYSSWKINLENFSTEIFIDDFSYLVFDNEDVFYTERNSRRFSIYKKDIAAGEISLLRGSRNTEEITVRYEELALLNGELYYTTRVPAKVYEFRFHGEDRLIMDFPNDVDHYKVHYLNVYENNLYFAVGEKSSKIYEYNPLTKETKVIFSSDTYSAYMHFRIVGGKLFFGGGGDIICMGNI